MGKSSKSRAMRSGLLPLAGLWPLVLLGALAGLGAIALAANAQTTSGQITGAQTINTQTTSAQTTSAQTASAQTTAGRTTNGAGGLRLTFGVQQRLEAADNLALDTNNQGTTVQAATDLSFGVISETRLSRLTFNLSGKLRLADTPDPDTTGLTFEGPQVSFGYSRFGANASFDLTARLRNSEVEFLRPLEDFIDENGLIQLPEDLGDLNGTGTRRSYAVNAALNWGTAAPFGFGIRAGVSGLSYSNTTSAGLVDNRRQNVGAQARFDLSPVTTATLDLDYSHFEEQGTLNPPRDTITLAAGLTRTLTNGTASASLTTTETEDGNRLGFSVGRSYVLPNATLSASLGATRAEDGNTNLTGALSLQQALPRGQQVSAQLRRSVASGNNDTTRVFTLASVSYSQPLSPVSSLGVSLSYGQSEVVATGNAVNNTSLSATYTRSLTPDWGLDVGVSHRIRTSDTASRAKSSAVFMVLRRSFDFRP